MTEHEWDELKSREQDESLTALFKFVDAPAPLPGFTSRTMKAVRRASLPAGRSALRHPLTAPLAWGALIGGSSLAAGLLAVYQPGVAQMFASLLNVGIRVGIWLMHVTGSFAALSDVFTTTGMAIARSVATTQGSIGLVLTAATGALSLAALRRLLVSESEATKWQELS